MSEHVVRRFLPRTSWKTGDKETAWRAGANGKNGFLSIWTFAGIEAPAATMAQERAEWAWKHKWAVTIAAAPLAVLAWAAARQPAFVFVLPIIYMLAYLAAANSAVMKRRMEFFGHAVSVVVAARLYPGGLPYFEERHVRSLAPNGAHDYAQFKGWSWERIRAGLRAMYPAAERWVKAHDSLVRSYDADARRLAGS